MRLIDLSQPWSSDTPAFPSDENPTIQWVKRLPKDRTYGQRITTTLHAGTHMDAPLHWVSGARDVAGLELHKLYRSGVVADVSDELGDYGVILPEHITRKVDIQEGDILLIHTGYHDTYFCGSRPDEEAYFLKHSGGARELAEWVVDMKLAWVGIDAGSLDHPMNSVLRLWRPDCAREAERVLGKPLGELFPEEDMQIMHTHLFKHDVYMAENIGGDIDRVLNQRVDVCAFPWKFVGGEAAMCRIVAVLPD